MNEKVDAALMAAGAKIAAVQAENDRLRREVESLRADAERYRWLREAIDHGPLALCEEAAGEPYRWSPIASYCQEFVDAARKPTAPAP